MTPDRLTAGNVVLLRTIARSGDRPPRLDDGVPLSVAATVGAAGVCLVLTGLLVWAGWL